ncbi:MAG: phosphoribosyltransferase family protein [Myxococcota bacterium]
MPHKPPQQRDVDVGSWRMRIKGLQREAEQLLDVVLPTRCLACGDGAHPDEQRLLCLSCSAGWRRLPEGCLRCGLPDDTQALPFTCEKCLQTPPHFARARALAAYDGTMPALVRTLKEVHGRRLATYFGIKLAEQVTTLFPGPLPTLVVPVPLHWQRLLTRGFNQALRLAEPVAERLQIPLVDALRRATPIHKQAWLGKRARNQNQQLAIQVEPAEAARLSGQHVLVIDDVYTTGSTGNLCTQALKAAGAAEVDVLTLARTL